MQRQSGAGAVAALVMLALLIIGAYTAFTTNAVYQDLDGGRQKLAGAQAALAAGSKAADARQLQAAAADLHQAELNFQDAQGRALDDPALRAMRAMPWSGAQVEAAAHLGGIGAHLSRAGEAATSIALQVSALERQYSGRTLTPEDLQALLQRAQAIVGNYAGSIDQIGRELKAAHAERAQVTTANLVAPLQDAYRQVDAALANADSIFARYQDVRQLLNDLLGLRLSG